MIPKVKPCTSAGHGVSADLVVLVGRHRDEFSLSEDAAFKSAVGKLLDIVRLHHVKSWLIFVHRIENCLQKRANTKPF